MKIRQRRSRQKQNRKFNLNRISVSNPFSVSTMSWFIAAMLLGLNVYYVIHISTGGAKYANMEYIIDAENKNKLDLERKLVNSSSLLKLDEKSSELGYSKAINMVYINADDTYATKLR